MNKVFILFETSNYNDYKEVVGTHKTRQGAISRAKLHSEESGEPLEKDEVQMLLNESQTKGRMTNYLLEEYDLNY